MPRTPLTNTPWISSSTQHNVILFPQYPYGLCLTIHLLLAVCHENICSRLTITVQILFEGKNDEAMVLQFYSGFNFKRLSYYSMCQFLMIDVVLKLRSQFKSHQQLLLLYQNNKTEVITGFELHIALVFASVPLQTFALDFKKFQWKCPQQRKNGLALSEMKCSSQHPQASSYQRSQYTIISEGSCCTLQMGPL